MAFSCLNEYRILPSGEVVFSDAESYKPSLHKDLKNWPTLEAEIEGAFQKYLQIKTIESYSDYAVLLVYQGKYEKARDIFWEIERKSPGRYQTASNLGTVYELLGKSDSAYIWIDKSLKINPNSHDGSEWIHLKILEAKVKFHSNPASLANYNILGLDFGNEIIPKYKGDLKPYDIMGHLYHQLGERLTFIAPKDVIMGRLLFDLGNCLAIEVDATSALELYLMAEEFGFTNEVMQKRIAEFRRSQRWADFWNWEHEFVDKNFSLVLGLLFTFFITGCLVSFLIIRKIIRSFKKRENP